MSASFDHRPLATATTLTYAGFEADASPTVPFNFSIGSINYTGKQWAVNLRLHATRTVNGQVCTADSPTVTVTKVTAVDP